MAFWLSVSILTLTLLVILYSYIQYKLKFWERRNVPYIESTMPFGSIKGMGTTEHISHMMQRFYHKLKGHGQIGGFFIATKPVVLAIDLNFVKHMLIKDFNSFQDRGFYYNERDNPPSAHLFSLDGYKWNRRRALLTQIFTSAKMKFMFSSVLEVAGLLQQYLIDISADCNELDINDTVTKFTTAVIGKCALGIDCYSLKDNQLWQISVKEFSESRRSLMTKWMMTAFKNVARVFRMKIVQDRVADFFMRIVQEKLIHRKAGNIKCNDFMDLLIELTNMGELHDNDVDALTVSEIAAQAFEFFLAGIETSSLTISYSLYELAHNKTIQDRARKEVQDVMKRHGEKLTYESMSELIYLDYIIQESLRKYPPVHTLIRMATREYEIPNTDIFLPMGSLVMVPIYAIHNDPEFFPNPTKFDPDRFLPSEVHRRHPMVNLPFGAGPRNCIGLRFGIMQVKIGMIAMLSNFKFSRSARSAWPIEFQPTKNTLASKDVLYLSIQPLAA